MIYSKMTYAFNMMNPSYFTAYYMHPIFGNCLIPPSMRNCGTTLPQMINHWKKYGFVVYPIDSQAPPYTKNV